VAPVVDRIVSAVEKGCTYASASSAGPISESTFHSWLRLGEADEIAGKDSPHAQFRRRIEAANLAAERTMTEQWVAHFPKDWRAIAEFMARRYPQRWRRTDADDRLPSYLSDDQRAWAIGDAMEHYLRVHDVDVPPELSTQVSGYLGFEQRSPVMADGLSTQVREYPGSNGHL